MFEFFLSSDPWVRFPLYACIGWMAEVLYTALCDLINPYFLCSWNVHGKGPMSRVRPDWRWEGRDSHCTGYTSLWMLPIYGCLIFLEPISLLMAAWPWFLRGLVYMGLIWLMEFWSGWLIKKITGHCPWDYSYSPYSFHGYIRWDFAPMWFAFGFIFEYLYPRLLALTPHIKDIF